MRADVAMSRVGASMTRDVFVTAPAASGGDLSSSHVPDGMTADPVTVEPHIDADHATERMMSKGFRHLPVLEAAGLTGIVSLCDIVRSQIGPRGRSSR